MDATATSRATSSRWPDLERDLSRVYGQRIGYAARLAFTALYLQLGGEPGVLVVDLGHLAGLFGATRNAARKWLGELERCGLVAIETRQAAGDLFAGQVRLWVWRPGRRREEGRRSMRGERQQVFAFAREPAESASRPAESASRPQTEGRLCTETGPSSGGIGRRTGEIGEPDGGNGERLPRSEGGGGLMAAYLARTAAKSAREAAESADEPAESASGASFREAEAGGDPLLSRTRAGGRALKLKDSKNTLLKIKAAEPVAESGAATSGAATAGEASGLFARVATAVAEESPAEAPSDRWRGKLVRVVPELESAGSRYVLDRIAWAIVSEGLPESCVDRWCRAVRWRRRRGELSGERAAGYVHTCFLQECNHRGIDLRRFRRS
jgi:hypothetical protein